MTPAALDRNRVEEKLLHLHELLDDLESLRGLDAAALADDRLARYAVERILIALVDLAASVCAHMVVGLGGTAPREYAASFRALAAVGVVSESTASAIEGSAGMRNVLVHQYTDVDLDLVAAAIPRAIDGYRSFVRDVAGWLVANR